MTVSILRADDQDGWLKESWFRVRTFGSKSSVWYVWGINFEFMQLEHNFESMDVCGCVCFFSNWEGLKTSSSLKFQCIFELWCAFGVCIACACLAFSLHYCAKLMVCYIYFRSCTILMYWMIACFYVKLTNDRLISANFHKIEPNRLEMETEPN